MIDFPPVKLRFQAATGLAEGDGEGDGVGDVLGDGDADDDGEGLGDAEGDGDGEGEVEGVGLVLGDGDVDGLGDSLLCRVGYICQIAIATSTMMTTADIARILFLLLLVDVTI